MENFRYELTRIARSHPDLKEHVDRVLKVSRDADFETSPEILREVGTMIKLVEKVTGWRNGMNNTSWGSDLIRAKWEKPVGYVTIYQLSKLPGAYRFSFFPDGSVDVSYQR